METCLEQGKDAQHVLRRRWERMASVKALAYRIEGAGADIAVNDPEHRQAGEIKLAAAGPAVSFPSDSPECSPLFANNIRQPFPRQSIFGICGVCGTHG